jgi:hypothetical protein
VIAFLATCDLIRNPKSESEIDPFIPKSLPRLATPVGPARKSAEITKGAP